MSDSLVLAKLDDGPEIFHSLQGEGASVGTPSVFVRLSRCNLHCVWCDTDYTWNFEGTSFRHQRDAEPGYRKPPRAEVQVTLPAERVAEIIRGFGCDNVIFTGGEPLLQQEGIGQVMRRLREVAPETTFEVETNGTLLPGADVEAFEPRYNVSPKLQNAGMRSDLCLVDAPLRFFAGCERATWKFVCRGEQDLLEVKELVAARGLPRRRVLLMPEAVTSEQLAERRPWLFEACLRLGFRYSDRLHVAVFGSRRGV
jgi:7-carboxy-7-deazaguanine synthase